MCPINVFFSPVIGCSLDITTNYGFVVERQYFFFFIDLIYEREELMNAAATRSNG